jgi:hypothetical protein
MRQEAEKATLGPDDPTGATGEPATVKPKTCLSDSSYDDRLTAEPPPLEAAVCPELVLEIEPPSRARLLTCTMWRGGFLLLEI